MNIKQIVFPEGVPLEYRDGSIRVIGSRITLDTLVGFFQQGRTARGLANSFPTLSLEQIKSVIAWYLTHQREADEYLAESEAEADAIWEKISSKPEYKAFHKEMLRRKEEFLRQRAQLSQT